MKTRFAGLIIATLTIRVFALSLGDNVSTNTIKVGTTTQGQSVMKLTKVATDHKEYTITSTNGTNVVLVNKSGIVYGFQWQEKSVDLREMLGSKYKAQFNTAYASRANKFNHRGLIIDTPDLSVRQFGLPGGPFKGTMYAKDIAPQ